VKLTRAFSSHKIHSQEKLVNHSPTLWHLAEHSWPGRRKTSNSSFLLPSLRERENTYFQPSLATVPPKEGGGWEALEISIVQEYRLTKTRTWPQAYRTRPTLLKAYLLWSLLHSTSCLTIQKKY
jgi:hypothetical protein